MGAQSVTVRVDAEPANLTVAAGTNATFTPDGVQIPSGLHLADASTADFRIRPNITLKTKNPTLNNGSFSKGKRWCDVKIPRLLSNGTYVTDIIRIEHEFHPETAAADVQKHRCIAAQMLFDSDLTSFWNAGSLS